MYVQKRNQFRFWGGGGSREAQPYSRIDFADRPVYTIDVMKVEKIRDPIDFPSDVLKK